MYKINLSDFKGDVSTDQEILNYHATDASVFKIMPETVLFPKDKEDVILVIKEIAKSKIENKEIKEYRENKENNLSLTVRAGGTCMIGGALNDSYILNMTNYMNKIHINEKEMTADIEMGAYFRDLESEALKYGLMFAPYPSSKMICGIGGMIGNNASGEKSLRYGSTSDNVLSLEIILSDGSILNNLDNSLDSDLGLQINKEIINLYKNNAHKLKIAAGDVPKHSSGYRLEKISYSDDVDKIDLTQVFIGAQGTLGVITKAKLKLVKIQKFSKLILIPISKMEDLPNIIPIARQSDAECIEIFDINTFNVAKIHMKEDTDLIGQFFNVDTTALMLVQFADDDEDNLDKDMQSFIDKLEALENSSIDSKINFHKILDENIKNAAWNIRRHAYSLLRDFNQGNIKAVPCIEDIIVPINAFPVLVHDLKIILEKNNVNYGYHGHVGEGSLRVIPLFDFDDERVGVKIIKLNEEVFALVKKLKGNLSGDHSDGIMRSPFLLDFYGQEICDVFKEVKNIFDPKNIFNPGKKVNSNKQDVMKHLNR